MDVGMHTSADVVIITVDTPNMM